jgi:hypothetical protein
VEFVVNSIAPYENVYKPRMNMMDLAEILKKLKSHELICSVLEKKKRFPFTFYLSNCCAVSCSVGIE